MLRDLLFFKEAITNAQNLNGQAKPYLLILFIFISSLQMSNSSHIAAVQNVKVHHIISHLLHPPWDAHPSRLQVLKMQSG